MDADLSLQCLQCALRETRLWNESNNASDESASSGSRRCDVELFRQVDTPEHMGCDQSTVPSVGWNRVERGPLTVL